VIWEAIDLLNRDSVRTALERLRPGIVYHCAGAAHVGRSWDSTEPTFAINVRGTHHLVEGLRDAGIPARVLVPGSALVYAASDGPLKEDDQLAPASPYALSKLAQELVGSGNPGGPDVLVARAFNHFGPRQDPWFVASGFARRIADIEKGHWAPEISVGNLDAKRDLTDVRDTVRAYQLIAERGAPGRPYNVCSGRAITVRELLQMMIERATVPVRIKIDPARYRPNDLPVLVGDPRRIHEELGWTAEIPLERTLDDLLSFWRGRT
jgi:GDP-4-dehydro-6-deoxy-D-mannose reductase